MLRHPLARPAWGLPGFPARAARFAFARPINHPLPPVLRLDCGVDAGTLAAPGGGGSGRGAGNGGGGVVRGGRTAGAASAGRGRWSGRRRRGGARCARLQVLYEQEGSAFQIEEVAGGFQLLTRPEYHPWLARLRRGVGEAQVDAGAARHFDYGRLPSAGDAGRRGGDSRSAEWRGAASVARTRPDPRGRTATIRWGDRCCTGRPRSFCRRSG